MAKTGNWSVGAKLMTAAVVGVLLTIGLCSVGTGLEGHGTPAQDFAASAGIITCLLSVVLFLAGIVALIVGMISRPK